MTSVKLDYDVIEPPCAEMDSVWVELLDGMKKNEYKMDLNIFKAGAAKGMISFHSLTKHKITKSKTGINKFGIKKTMNLG